MKKSLLTLAFLGLSLVPNFAQAPVSDAERKRIEEIVRNYIMNNPEIISEAASALERRQLEAEEKVRLENLTKNKDELYNPKNTLIYGNPKGNVTLVEFFDYNCGFCKRGFQDVVDLMKEDKNVKVIFRDFPVLGQGSMEAARVAVAVRMQATNDKFLEFHKNLLLGRGQANHDRAMEAAKQAGFDMPRLEKDLASAEIASRIKTNMQIGDSLKLSGTPSYVINEDVVVGAVGLATLKQKAEEQRKICLDKKTC